MSFRTWLAASLAAVFGATASAAPLDWIDQWRQFRSAYPYHIQTIALSRPDAAGKRLLIVAEPPPGVTMDQIVAVAPQLLGSAAIERSRVGFDGSVADALFELPPVGDGTLRSLVEQLHVRLFGTAYKAFASEIPSTPPPKAGYNLDLHLTAGTLAHWLVPPRPLFPPLAWGKIILFAALALYGIKFFRSDRRKRRALALLIGVWGLGYQFTPRVMYFVHRQPDLSLRFTPLAGGEPRTVAQLFDAKAAGVYASEKPGIVLWVVPRSSPLDGQQREARWFTLDSDILLGAVASGDYVAILGRERVVPVDLLPPLRTETILLLASVKQNELSQSYERKHFFAGRNSAGFAWAPIFLSDSLIDTEYGSLLNITDQLLKSWSMHGQIEYIRFGYPKPSTYPFPKPLLEFVNARQVTFNWNTKGAGYSLQSRGYDFFAWNRTGALPVDYLGGSDSELRSAEETGYNYFAQLSDPNLVRVVQYAQMYQIFRHYGITAAAHEPAFHLAAPPQFRAALLRMLSTMRNLDPARIDRAGLDDELAANLHKIKAGVDGIYRRGGDEALGDLADAIAAPRLFRQTHNASPYNESLLTLGAACVDAREVLVELTGLTRDSAMSAYVRYTDRPLRGWIYTPSIVESSGTGSSSNVTGGHNLDSTITGFRASSDVAAGEIKVIEENGSRIVLHNEADADRVGETVRTAAREDGSPEAIEAKLRASLGQAHEDTRPLADALGFSAAHQPDPARGLQAEHISAAIDHTGWWVNDSALAEKQGVLLGVLNSDGSHAIVVERTSQGQYLLFDGPSRRILQADNEPAAIDAMLAYVGSGKRAGAVRLHLRGFEPRAARGFTQSAELQLAGFGDVPEINATLDTAELDPQKLKVLLAERYNFREVTIKEVSAPFVTPEGEMAVHVDAEVAIAKSAEPLHVRFLIALKRGVQVTAELIRDIQTTILTAFRGGEIRAANDGTLLLTGKIIGDLQRISPDISYVHARISSKEIKDLYIVLLPDALSRRPVSG